MQELKAYFEAAQGLGILSTADESGKVTSAVYAKPHFMEDGMIAFIMRDKLSHTNLEENPYAVYLFREEKAGYSGKRLYLKKFDESDDETLINKVRKQSCHVQADEYSPVERMFLVFFQVEKVLPLIGEG